MEIVFLILYFFLNIIIAIKVLKIAWKEKGEIYLSDIFIFIIFLCLGFIIITILFASHFLSQPIFKKKK